MIRRASRIANVGGSPSLAIAERARQLRQAGKPVIDLSLGELDFDTPRNVREAAVRAIEAGATGYDSVAGGRKSRERCCGKRARAQ